MDKEVLNMGKSYKLIVISALLAHVIYLLAFTYSGITVLQLYNLGSVIFYAIMEVLVSKKYYRVATILVHVEICLFVIVSVVMLGWDFGFQAILVAVCTLMYFNPFTRKRRIYVFPIMEFVLFMVLRNWSLRHGPMIAAEGEGYYYYLNYTFCFGIIIFGAIITKIATDRLERENTRMTRDSLTNVYNHDFFIEEVGRVLRRSGKQYYLLCTNISGFKFYNELFGVEQGDKVLVEQANMLKAAAGQFCVYGRLAGDEFGILIEKDNYSEEQMTAYLNELQKKFSTFLYHMHICAGVYEIRDNTEPVNTMCEKARIAVDEIKDDYDCCITYFDDKLLQESLIKRRILGEFQYALEESQFCIYLQPQMTGEGRMLGAEALVRWIHPKEGMISPADFIPVLEESGLISRLDLFVWDQAAQVLRKWKEQGREDLYISVNVSGKDFYYTDLYEAFTGLVKKYEIKPENLKIEITETVLMKEAEKQMGLLQKLRDFGFEIEIDDFGSGYSSLSMLKDIIVDVMKIDMGFLRKTDHGERSWSIIRSVANLARTLEMNTVTEGVETKDQVTRLLDIGCDVFQGYYFARPMPVIELERQYLE